MARQQLQGVPIHEVNELYSNAGIRHNVACTAYLAYFGIAPWENEDIQSVVRQYLQARVLP